MRVAAILDRALAANAARRRQAPPDPAPKAAEPDHARRQMANLLRVAEKHAGGRRPGGWCYMAVSNYIRWAGYGAMPRKWIPAEYMPLARHFADLMNKGDNAAAYGLTRLQLDNPYDAPPGAIVVVRAGTPGTQHPRAGDISIAAGKGRFLNDGEMNYGGRQNFPPGNDYVLGVYVPA